MKSIGYFKGLSWLIILNLLVKPVWLFLIDRQVQNIVGFEEYGKYFSILNLSYVLFFLSDIGLTNMVNQKMAQNSVVNVAQLLRIKGFLLLLYFIVFCFVGWISHIPDWKILFYVLLIQTFTSILLFFRSIITANQFFLTDAWLSVADKSLMILLCGSIIYGSVFTTMSLSLFLQIQFVCTAAAASVSFLFILRKKLIRNYNKQSVDRIARQVIPFALIILLMSIHYRLDGFLLERVHQNGALEAGIYASAYRLLDAGNMVGYLATSFLVAFVAKHIKEKPLIENAILNTRHVLMFCAIGATSFVVVFAQWISQLLYHSNDSYNALIIQLCMASFPAYCFVHIYGSVLTGAGRLQQFITVLFYAVLLNIVLNIILIPAYGALGCCISALVSQYFCGLTVLLTATRRLSISYHGRSMVVYLLSAILLTAFFYVGKYAVINVWIILAIGFCFSLFLVSSQLSFFRKSFISLRQ